MRQEELELFLDSLASVGVMAYPDYELPYVLHTDASNEGLGAVLYQKQRVIGYGSRTLTPAEKRFHFHSGKLEFLALKWAITERFHDYLYHAPSFEVYTSNNPLTYVLKTAGLDATQQRWVAELADFWFKIKYRPDKKNGDADALSQLPLPLEADMKNFTQENSQNVVNAIVKAVKVLTQDLCFGMFYNSTSRLR